MKDIPFKQTITPRTKAFLLLAVLIIIGISVGYLVSLLGLQGLTERINELPIQVDESRITRSVNYYKGAMVILTVELVLLLGVFFVYYDSYRKTKSRFIIVLNFFLLVLIIKSALSLVSLHTIAVEYIRFIPYISRTFLTPSFGLLSFVITAFEILAACVLVYISME
ncbi:MAG: hypothetical protein JXA00_06145 [Candidatus Thermoplasmatota archaeon]|nr:hypothetical protein [Candidatus Thermoplasmatota archaeon]